MKSKRKACGWRRFQEGWAVTGLLIVLTACAPPAAATPQQTATMAPPMETPKAIPSATALSSPSPQPTPRLQACPVPPGEAPFPTLADPGSWAAEILEYLNAGGGLERLETHLSAASANRAAPSLHLADLTGDGLLDIVLSWIAWDDQAELTSAAVLIFRCDADEYRLAYAARPEKEGETPSILTVQDLTGDSLPDLLMANRSCGAHTCFSRLQLLSWTHSEFVQVLQGRTDDLPSPEIEILDADRPGPKRIAITATGIASAGAGPYRQKTRIWAWEAGQGRFLPVEEFLEPPVYRIHWVHDADQAAEKGHYEQAISLYQAVIEQDLDDWIYGPEGGQRLAAYALYRQMLVHLWRSDPAAADETLNFLQNAHPAGSPGSAYAALAMRVWEAFQEGGGRTAACQVAETFAAANAAEIIDPLNYGYANRIYTAQDLCLPLDLE